MKPQPAAANAYLNSLLEGAGVSKTVYAYVMPETEKALDEIMDADRASLQDMYREAWTQKQDAVHEEFIDAWKSWSAPVVKFDDRDFPFFYTTSGASEALREAIYAYGHRARTQGFSPVIHVFEGEYEGFAAYAQAAGIAVVTHPRANWAEAVAKIGPKDQFYISQPSAIDGNVWGDFDAFAAALEARQPSADIVLDLTYVGCVARSFTVKTESPNIRCILFSLSKPMGVYYHRIGGMLSREAYPGLFGNKWFKNLLSIRLGTKLLREYGVHELATKYAQMAQGVAIKEASDRLGLDLVPSDVFLLATAELKEGAKDLEKYLSRAGRLRVCLTPSIASIVNPSVSRIVRARAHETVTDRAGEVART